MPNKRSPKWDDDVDPIRAKAWFKMLGNSLGETSPRNIQRLVNPGSLIASDYGLKVPNNKFKHYLDGETVPSPALVAEAEQHVKGSSWLVNHVLWRVLRSHGSIASQARSWLYELVSVVSGLVFTPEHEIRLRGDRHFLPALERRASLDSLTALTIIFKLNLEAGDEEQAWHVANSIFRVLMLIGTELLDLEIVKPLFNLYVDRIFSQVSFDGKMFNFEKYNFEVVATLLEELTRSLQTKLAKPRDRRMPSYYGLQIIEGRYCAAYQKFFIPRIKKIDSAP